MNWLIIMFGAYTHKTTHGVLSTLLQIDTTKGKLSPNWHDQEKTSEGKDYQPLSILKEMDYKQWPLSILKKTSQGKRFSLQ